VDANLTFNSLWYFLFLPLVFLIFNYVPDRFRWLVLLVASYGFYATFKAPQLLVVLALVTVISYGCGIQLGRITNRSHRTLIVWMGAAACVLILAVMKGLPLILASGAGRDSSFGYLLISVGVSFYTLQAISYLADNYLEIQEPERHLGYHALYLSFFPKLLQGPIERAGDLLPQLKRKYEFSYNTVRAGMLLFAWGLFKKVVVADRLALFVNPIYDDVHSFAGIPLLAATYFYAIQIYCDFSGYTDMALGTARLFNIGLTQNFYTPYFATSVADFWRRWHISFSRWLLDYVFKPLQLAFRGRKNWGTSFALVVTFLVSGIWHGSTWGFVIWGLLHGLYLAASVFYRPLQKRIHNILRLEGTAVAKLWQMIVTFHLVTFAWIFFRSNTLFDAYYVLSAIPKDLPKLLDFRYVQIQFRGLGLEQADLILCVVFVLIVFVMDILEVRIGTIWSKLLDKPLWIRWTVYYALIVLIIFFAPYSTAKNFIYLQF